MAIDLRTEYPAQVVHGLPGWPFGQPKNESTPGQRDGFPLEKRWLQDVHGFLQALLFNDGAEPSGEPDKFSASQYRQAIVNMIDNAVAALNDGRVEDIEERVESTENDISSIISRVESLENTRKVQETFAFYAFTESVAYDSGDRYGLDLVLRNDPVGTFTESSGRVTLPGNGTYLIIALGEALNGGGGTVLQLEGNTVATCIKETFAMMRGQVITNPPGQRVSVASVNDHQNVAGGLFIKRLL